MSGPDRIAAAPAPDAELELKRLRERLEAKLKRMALDDFAKAAGIHPSNLYEIQQGRVPNDAEYRHLVDTLDRLGG
jgi:predicted transcriptional regulator